MEGLFGIASVAVLTAICYLVALGAKATALDNKWLPVICGVLGGALGPLAMTVIEDFPATDYLTAIAVGIVSGLAATGIDQVRKQLGKSKGE
ncbi:MAG: phage holin family protein [Oscillospiraceae bacterium]